MTGAGVVDYTALTHFTVLIVRFGRSPRQPFEPELAVQTSPPVAAAMRREKVAG